MEFHFQGQRFRESTHARNKALADRIARERLRELEEGRSGVKRAVQVRTFSASADEWLEMKKVALEANSSRIETTNLSHLKPFFGKKLASDIRAEDVARYQRMRIDKGYANKTVNLEVGTLRAILKYTGHWAAIQPNVTMLKDRSDIGKSLSSEEETTLLAECACSRSRSLVVFITLALYTGRRFGVIRQLKWENIDFKKRVIKWGKGKSDAGDYQTLPMGERVIETLKMWAMNFPNREPGHYVFASERNGASGHKFEKMVPIAYDTDPTKPMGSNKTAWEGARKRSGIKCRLHDMRHTASSRMQEDGVPLMQIAQLMGWSPSTTVLMARRYGHFNTETLRYAVDRIKISPSPLNRPPFFEGRSSISPN